MSRAFCTIHDFVVDPQNSTGVVFQINILTWDGTNAPSAPIDINAVIAFNDTPIDILKAAVDAVVAYTSFARADVIIVR